MQSLGLADPTSGPVPDMSSLVTEVINAANNQEITDNNDASDGAAAPNREFIVKEEVPEIKDEIFHDNEADMETGSLNLQLSSSREEPAGNIDKTGGEGVKEEDVKKEYVKKEENDGENGGS